MLQRFKSSLKTIKPNRFLLDKHHPLWSEGFRPFFLLLPLYAIISIIPWGLIWGGVFTINFTSQLLYWHIYEMIYGLGMAGILGFLLTAIPEFIEGTPRVRGYRLASLLAFWLVGRISFWLFSFSGLWGNFLLHIGLSVTILALLTKPIWQQKPKKNIGFWWCLLLLTVIQALFFISQSNTALTLLPNVFSTITPIQWLYAAIHAFMILIVLVLRRVTMGVTNTLLDQYNIDEKFMARPPMFNLATSILLIFMYVELAMPNQSVLGWIAWAVGCALLNLLNDFFKLSVKVLLWHHVRYLILIIILMAMGYFAIGWDYLSPNFNVMNHLRHILTTGVIGMAYLTILSIVSLRHTGRPLRQSYTVDVMIIFVLVSLGLRLSIIVYPTLAPKLYMWSALVWALAFVLFLVKYARYMLKANIK